MGDGIWNNIVRVLKKSFSTHQTFVTFKITCLFTETFLGFSRECWFSIKILNNNSKITGRAQIIEKTDYRLLQMPQSQSRMVLELWKSQQFYFPGGTTKHNIFMALGVLFSSLYVCTFPSLFHFCCFELCS